VKIYGIYIGYDCVTIAVRNIGKQAVVPLLVQPLDKTMDRESQVLAAFSEIIGKKKRLEIKGVDVAAISFESPENVCFMTVAASEIPDITEMMSWEMFTRTGEPVKDYNISAFHTFNDIYFVAGSRIKEIMFYRKLIGRLGLKVAVVQPSLAAALNVMEMNYKMVGVLLVAFLSQHKIVIALLENGKLKDMWENSLLSHQRITSKDVMKGRAEISKKHAISEHTTLYITGDLLADKDYAESIVNDMQDCTLLDPFCRISASDTTDKELLQNHSFIFGAAVSLSMERVKV
jgi:hypothetical protein